MAFYYHRRRRRRVSFLCGNVENAYQPLLIAPTRHDCINCVTNFCPNPHLNKIWFDALLQFVCLFFFFLYSQSGNQSRGNGLIFHSILRLTNDQNCRLKIIILLPSGTQFWDSGTNSLKDKMSMSTVYALKKYFKNQFFLFQNIKKNLF